MASQTTSKTDYRAVEFSGDGSVRIAERKLVEPAEGQLRVRVRMTGLCATDTEIRDGEMEYFRTGRAEYPVVPGHEWVGTVDAVGPGVVGFSPGDRVVGECSIGCGACTLCAEGDYHLCEQRAETGLISQPGGLAEYILFPARSAHRIPDNISDADAALVEPAAIALRAVDLLEVQQGTDVLVIGAGPIGLLAAQAAQAHGGDVSVLDRSDSRLEIAERVGIKGIAVNDVSVDGRSWSRIIDASGSGSGLRSAIELATPRGHIVSVSLCGRPIADFPVDTLVTKGLQLTGSIGSPGVWGRVVEMIERGAFTPGALVSATYSFDEVEEAMRHVGAPGEMKIVVRVHDGQPAREDKERAT